MDHTAFIFLSYAVTIGGVGALILLSWRRMRRAESAIARERDPV